ncbi:50S ribosomal protein L28 [Streptomyces sp. NPDC058293]|uniref:50S ribosomal protein L28 n=1 Tax=Streptomyces sp. NPDC058293 TaxID=3346429 RepID=UPI0036E5868B
MTAPGHGPQSRREVRRHVRAPHADRGRRVRLRLGARAIWTVDASGVGAAVARIRARGVRI